jgi:hypothetical protein
MRRFHAVIPKYDPATMLRCDAVVLVVGQRGAGNRSRQCYDARHRKRMHVPYDVLPNGLIVLHADSVAWITHGATKSISHSLAITIVLDAV